MPMILKHTGVSHHRQGSICTTNHASGTGLFNTSAQYFFHIIRHHPMPLPPFSRVPVQNIISSSPMQLPTNPVRTYRTRPSKLQKCLSGSSHIPRRTLRQRTVHDIDVRARAHVHERRETWIRTASQTRAKCENAICSDALARRSWRPDEADWTDASPTRVCVPCGEEGAFVDGLARMRI